MEIRFHASIESFRDLVLPCLMECEAENNLILSITTRLLQGQIPGPPIMASVEDQGSVVGACVKTPLRGLVITRLPEPAPTLLAASIREVISDLPGVAGPSDSARDFAAAWAALKGIASRRHASLRVYELESVIAPQPTAGAMEQAGLEDVERMGEWSAAMVKECRMQNMPYPKEDARHSVERGETFVWRDTQLVSMAIARHGTPNGARIGMVYTPPEFRRRGYASALVAELSGRMLASGCSRCFLFTDLSNPTSNSIYIKIGYRPVCDFEDHTFGVD